MILQFSENFTILLFHYDGRTSEWDEFEWSKRAIHVSVRKQTKWWDIVLLIGSCSLIAETSLNFTMLLLILGGTLNDFCTLTLWLPTITYLSGMKTSELSISMPKSMSSPFVFFLCGDVCSTTKLEISFYFVRDHRYIKLVKKHGLEISQPGLEPNRGLTWQMTKRRGDREVHKWASDSFIGILTCLL